MVNDAGRPAHAKTFPGTRATGIPRDELDALVRVRPLLGDDARLIVIEPAIDGVDLAAWGLARRARVMALLHRQGAVLFRHFAIEGGPAVRHIAEQWFGAPMSYVERSSPRRIVLEGVYTSTEHPSDQPILFHNESSYAASWPRHLFFYCETPAASGGRTPLADCRRVLLRLRPETIETFAAKGLLYLRTFAPGLGYSWREAFQLDDRDALERFLTDADYAWRWSNETRSEVLHTSRRAPAIVTHPDTGERVWFNHVALFHPSSLEPELRDLLLAQCGPNDLPFDCRYGDGTPIAAAEVEEIREAYRAEADAFAWQPRDLLLVDNMLVAHGREPFTGDRRILTTLSTPWSGR